MTCSVSEDFDAEDQLTKLGRSNGDTTGRPACSGLRTCAAEEPIIRAAADAPSGADVRINPLFAWARHSLRRTPRRKL
jgi:hypothetical protein